MFSHYDVPGKFTLREISLIQPGTNRDGDDVSDGFQRLRTQIFLNALGSDEDGHGDFRLRLTVDVVVVVASGCSFGDPECLVDAAVGRRVEGGVASRIAAGFAMIQMLPSLLIQWNFVSYAPNLVLFNKGDRVYRVPVFLITANQYN